MSVVRHDSAPVRGVRHKKKVIDPALERDDEYLRARDREIVKMREKIFPYRHVYTWPEIGKELHITRQWARARYKAIPDDAKADIREGLWD